VGALRTHAAEALWPDMMSRDSVAPLGPGVYQSQWGALRTPALVGVIIVAAILKSALFRATQ